ncbi:hypothetical protein [Brunnivagina elsteri]|uniref:Uncharacterized protein n=1 Tax=Brunnivagina elsteri CCALA 953 TaxID=987040 RepID=A0A2A2THI2_9CYAN|nr:hypothetical protein [Calothrix elsteri]PAX53182.1 hypothetical protein CK510_15315 [Calothrix elsteri CCALA 953]
MKPGIRRIEATLQNLDNRNITPAESQGFSKAPLSFQIYTNPSEAKNPNSDTESPQVVSDSDTQENTQADILTKHESVQAFKADDSEGKTPNLPKFKIPNFTSHRNVANPALASNLLIEIQQIVTAWQVELQTIVRQIQDIYLEGPIVNGWLESQPPEPAKETPIETPTTGTATLRNAEVEQLMNYVEEICATQAQNGSKNVLKDASSKEILRTGYRLCGLDAAGKAWNRPCPPEQVASVSMAIARYQKLRIYLTRKQELETHLAQLSETLIMLHAHLQSQQNLHKA